MSAPSVIKVSPNPNTSDVVLGTQIVVGFDQLMDTTTINASTFSLTGPGQTQVLSPTELNVKNPRPGTGREYINGTFVFATDTSGCTVLTFSPGRPLRPNVEYTVLLVGPVSTLGQAITNTTGETLDSNYQYPFTTGDLDVSVPPVTSPLTPLVMPLDPSKVKIQQQIWAVGNDLSQEIVITFPAPIDKNSVRQGDILLALEAILNDPSVSIPPGLEPTIKIKDNKITITISGWPLT